MDLQLLRDGKTREFGDALKEARSRIPPVGWSQQDLAHSIVISIAKVVFVWAAQRDPEIRAANEVAFLKASAAFASDFGDKAYLLIRSYFLDEVRKMHPRMVEWMIALHFTHDGRAMDNDEEAEDLSSLTRKYIGRWRSRVANIEAGRRMDIRIAEVIVNEIVMASNLHERPQTVLGEHASLFKLPFFGEVPRKARMDEFDWENRQSPIEVMPRWKDVQVDFALRVASKAFEPIFYHGELIAVQGASILAYDVVALLHGPLNELTLKVLRPGEDDEIRIHDVPDNGGWLDWNPSWSLLGYVLCREGIAPSGMRLRRTTSE